jgi:hypothetical protein
MSYISTDVYSNIAYCFLSSGEKVSQGGMSDITCISFNQGNLAWTNDFQMPCAPQHNNQVKTCKSYVDFFFFFVFHHMKRT